jgi:hypothetical protein
MRKIQRHTRFEMFSHVEAFRSSQQSQRNYCKRQGIALSTFQYWAKKYREEFSEDDNPDETPGFIPVRVEPDPEVDQVRTPGQLHFLFPNGIQVMCSESVDPEVLKTLLNPSPCSH